MTTRTMSVLARRVVWVFAGPRAMADVVHQDVMLANAMVIPLGTSG